jgi:hypothetical protein
MQAGIEMQPHPKGYHIESGGGCCSRVKPSSQLELDPRCRSKFTERRSRTTDTNAISAAPWQFLFVEYL